MLDFRRQEPILDHRKGGVWPVTVVGCGGIGSTIAPDLPLMGFQYIKLIDGDMVEPHNPQNQPGFTKGDVGKSKARTLARRVRQKGAARVVPYAVMFDPVLNSQLLEGVVIVAVDSMERVGDRPCGRREIWEAVKENRDRIPFFVDGRLGGEMFDCYAFAPSDIDAVRAYEAQLFPQSNASTDACTQGAIIYTVRALAAEMQHQIAAWLRRERAPWRIARDFKLIGTDASPILREFL